MPAKHLTAKKLTNEGQQSVVPHEFGIDADSDIASSQEKKAVVEAIRRK
jgi:hypothetical protein